MRFGLCAFWLLAAAGGAWVLASYGNTPGATGQTPPQWPVDSQIVPAQDHPTLVMFAHPQCPCTRASLAELNRLLVRCQGRLVAKVLFIQPAGPPQDWTQSGLWKDASRIPGVAVSVDAEGAEARHFGAESSGYVVLYDRHGKLLFNGGITAARGQAGDNSGENVIVALVNDRNAQLNQTPVFGCELFDPTTASSLQISQ